jgi:hypothetical protein
MTVNETVVLFALQLPTLFNGGTVSYCVDNVCIDINTSLKHFSVHMIIN